MEVFKKITENGFFFRVESDEEGIYMSIIDRNIYPRIWSDNIISGDFKIESESNESFIERTFLSGKDWSERWFCKDFEECMRKAEIWLKSKIEN